jgi:nicotinamide-nucleotide amidase
MKAEIIAVGSEMLTPDSIDTNSLYLTRRLREAGCSVHLKTVVGDEPGEIVDVLRAALDRSDLILVSGGLGPTEDDRTREAAARVLGRPIRIDPHLLGALKGKFAARGLRMNKNNERQAEVIEGAEVLDNPFGTAPGMWLEERGRLLALLPGPPRELEPMFEASVAPRIAGLGGGERLACRSLYVTGIAESELDARIAPLYAAYPRVQATVLAGTRHIAVRLYRWVPAGEEGGDLDELAARIQAELGDAVFSTAGETMEEVIGRLLRDSNRTLAVAESCTAGMLGMQITRVAGSSAWFLGGVLCYSNSSKRDLCAVPEEVLRRYGAVSAETAEALARGVRLAFGSSIGLSVTGIAGPGGGSEEKPVGLVHVGYSDGERTESLRRILPGDRESIRERSAALALSWLRRFLLRPGEDG